MIDIKELRIGNWIMDKKPFQVYAETFADIESTYTNFQPIPLSPEVLTACGFEKKYLDRKKVDEGCYYEKEVCSKYYGENYYCDLTFITGDKNGFLEVCLLPVEESVRVRYLHELQNLFYCLAGEELNYTP
jgi:hypothetical protein